MPTFRTTLRLLWLLAGALALAACQPSPAERQATIDAQVALAVVATQAALPTATAYATSTMQPTLAAPSTATEFPEPPPLATATVYPTSTMYPTHTPEPTSTPTPIPPTAVAVAQPPRPATPQSSPLQKQMALLDQMTLLHNLLVEFGGSVGTLITHGSPDCNRLIQIFDTVKALPEMDVTGTDIVVQQAYTAYRSSIEHFTKPETVPGDVVMLCRTQPENLQNISGLQVSTIVLYVEHSDSLVEHAWQTIGGR